MNAPRPLKTVVKMFMLPAACFACIVWAGIFVVIFTHSSHNLGTDTLLIVGGIVLVFPWAGMAVAMLRRMGANNASAHAAAVGADGNPDGKDRAVDPD